VLLKSTAELDLTPALTKIKIDFNMSETLAGVTILAWANGAPDVIVSLSAGGIEGGVSLAIGSLFGAGIFTTTIVYANCLYISKELKVVFI
jgi:sodium/potassium/calcium exchanger 6